MSKPTVAGKHYEFETDKDFGSAKGLYELGHAISGTEHIRHFAGKITVEKAD